MFPYPDNWGAARRQLSSQAQEKATESGDRFEGRMVQKITPMPLPETAGAGRAGRRPSRGGAHPARGRLRARGCFAASSWRDVHLAGRSPRPGAPTEGAPRPPLRKDGESQVPTRDPLPASKPEDRCLRTRLRGRPRCPSALGGSNPSPGSRSTWSWWAERWGEAGQEISPKFLEILEVGTFPAWASESGLDFLSSNLDLGQVI